MAPGTSLTQAQADLVRQYPVAVVAVGNAFLFAPWADVLYHGDAPWWGYHAQEALKFEGLKLTVDKMVKYRSVRILKETGVEGYDPTPGCVRTGNNSGYQAIHVAIQAGAKRILMLGFDMRPGHFFGRHPMPLRNTDPSSFEVFKKRFPALRGRGAEIINCTPGSALQCFPMMPLAEALNG